MKARIVLLPLLAFLAKGRKTSAKQESYLRSYRPGKRYPNANFLQPKQAFPKRVIPQPKGLTPLPFPHKWKRKKHKAEQRTDYVRSRATFYNYTRLTMAKC